MIAIDLNKQQTLDVDPRATQQIEFTATQILQVTEESFSFLKKPKNCFGLFTRNCKSTVNVLYNNLIFINIK